MMLSDAINPGGHASIIVTHIKQQTRIEVPTLIFERLSKLPRTTLSKALRKNNGFIASYDHALQSALREHVFFDQRLSGDIDKHARYAIPADTEVYEILWIRIDSAE